MRTLLFLLLLFVAWWAVVLALLLDAIGYRLNLRSLIWCADAVAEWTERAMFRCCDWLRLPK